MLRLVSFVLLTLQLLLLPRLDNADAVLDLWTKGQPALNAQLAKSTTCSKDKLQIRKEWGDLTDSEKSSYINAVLCLTKAPSKLDPTKYPGAKSGYDDFVVVHINQTLSIHGTLSLMAQILDVDYSLWYDSAEKTVYSDFVLLRYWNWGRCAADPEKSPIFDGTMLSLSGNGEKIPHSGTIVTGNGGGCTTSGPSKNMTVNLGPISLAINPAPPANPRSDGYGYNPRYLRRDISNQLSSRYSRTEDIVKLITSINSIGTFQDTMQKHKPGQCPRSRHYTISGDPGERNLMLDFNSRAQSLDDIMDLNVVEPKTYKIRELVSVVDGPFCYYYA
ncbi:hypothetical protein SCAR479_04052 [Seiridium cardinale]|uniref:Tyrosinase copper-binding domain-containing protein n=1 Tax=Seiridium cardinale TaxID=138064 RepID=A0ABR2Y079_9PEZI